MQLGCGKNVVNKKYCLLMDRSKASNYIHLFLIFFLENCETFILLILVLCLYFIAGSQVKFKKLVFRRCITGLYTILPH